MSPDTRVRQRWLLPTGWQVTTPALVLLLVPGILSFGPIFGGTQGWVAAGGGAVLGLGVAFLAAARRWGWLEVLAASLITYLLFGGALALPSTTIAGFVPTLDTLRRLVTLTAYAWRDLLTVSLPASLFTGPAVVPYLAALLCSVVAGTIALRTSRPGFSLLPLGALLAVGILWGVHTAPLALGLGTAFGVVAMVWLAWVARKRATSDASELLGLEGLRAGARPSWAGGAAIVAIAAVAAVGANIVMPAPQRFVLRDTVVPPLHLEQYASPLTMFRYLETTLQDQTLFTISGVPTGSRVRLAAVDAYDGVVYNVDAASAAYQRVGASIADERQPTGTATMVDVTIGQYAGVWLPGGGDLRGVSFSGTKFDQSLFYNQDSGTALTTVGLSEGDSYRLSVVPHSSPAPASLAGVNFAKVTLPPDTDVPEAVTTMSQQLVGNASTPIDQVTKLASELRSRGFYSNGSDGRSLSGESAARLTTLLTAKQMIGDDEQYSVAMALMARQLGIPARVVMGFYPDASKNVGSAAWAVTGGQAHIWVEVAFEGVGWVPFDPTPDRAKTPNTDVPQPKSDPKPQVLPPPEQANNTADDNKDIVDDQRRAKSDTQPAWVQVAWIVAVAVGGAAVVASPFLVVIALKRRRRRRRLNGELMSDRAHGGWLEVVDRATDLGKTFEPTATRRETSSIIETAFPGAGSVAVADRIDAGVFGAAEPSVDDVAAMWSQVDAVLGRMSGSVPRWRRWVSAVSPRSLGLTRRRVAGSLSPSRLAGRARRATTVLVVRILSRGKDADVQ
ncbi:MAG: transglutaminase-like domain-containing protein [Propionibacteriaceae bacterium]